MMHTRSGMIAVALQHRMIDVVRLLLRLTTTNGINLYGLLIKNKHTNMMKLLISRMDHIDPIYLHYAAMYGSYDIVDVLLDAGLDINARCVSNTIALHHAINVSMASYLITKGADINASSHYGTTPLHTHIKKSNIEVALLLIGLGANTDAKEYYGTMPIDYATEKDIIDVLDYTIVHDASIKGLYNLVKGLITNGIDINRLDHRGRTPLHYACQEGHLMLVSWLILNGANVHIADRWGRTPYLEAISSLFYIIIKTNLYAVRITDYFLICKMLTNLNVSVCNAGHVYMRSIRARIGI